MSILVPSALARKKEARDETNDKGGHTGSGDSNGERLSRVDGRTFERRSNHGTWREEEKAPQQKVYTYLWSSA